MAKIAFHRRFRFGISCVECGNELIAPEKSEYRHGGHIRHMWLCPGCTACFDSLEQVPIEEMTSDDVVPRLLVA